MDSLCFNKIYEIYQCFANRQVKKKKYAYTRSQLHDHERWAIQTNVKPHQRFEHCLQTIHLFSNGLRSAAQFQTRAHAHSKTRCSHFSTLCFTVSRSYSRTINFGPILPTFFLCKLPSSLNFSSDRVVLFSHTPHPLFSCRLQRSKGCMQNQQSVMPSDLTPPDYTHTPSLPLTININPPLQRVHDYSSLLHHVLLHFVGFSNTSFRSSAAHSPTSNTF